MADNEANGADTQLALLNKVGSSEASRSMFLELAQWVYAGDVPPDFAGTFRKVPGGVMWQVDGPAGSACAILQLNPAFKEQLDAEPEDGQ